MKIFTEVLAEIFLYHVLEHVYIYIYICIWIKNHHYSIKRLFCEL